MLKINYNSIKCWIWRTNTTEEFFNDKIHNYEKLINYILKHPNEFKLSGNNILYLDKKKLRVFERCREVVRVLNSIVFCKK